MAFLPCAMLYLLHDTYPLVISPVPFGSRAEPASFLKEAMALPLSRMEFGGDYVRTGNWIISMALLLRNRSAYAYLAEIVTRLAKSSQYKEAIIMFVDEIEKMAHQHNKNLLYGKQLRRTPRTRALLPSLPIDVGIDVCQLTIALNGIDQHTENFTKNTSRITSVRL